MRRNRRDSGKRWTFGRAPRFEPQGRKIVNARFERVTLNGRLVQDNVEVAHPTGSVWREKEHAAGRCCFRPITARWRIAIFACDRCGPRSSSAPARVEELRAEDFDFHGPLGSDGRDWSGSCANHFQLTLGHAPKHDAWANMVQFEIAAMPDGSRLRLDVKFDHPKPEYLFDDYPLSWCHDGQNWRRIAWSAGGEKGRARTLEFPSSRRIA